MTTGIVLAGGRSRRFGRDKLSAPLADGRSILAHAVEAVAAACETVVVVVAPDAAIPDGLPARAILVRDDEAYGGPVIGLVAGLEALGTGEDEIVVVTGGDMPSLSPAVLRRLVDELAAKKSRPATVVCVRLGLGEVGSAAIMPCAVRRDAALGAARASLAAGDRRLRGVLERLPTAIVEEREWRMLDPSARSLLDVDRPSDLPGVEPDADGRGVVSDWTDNR